MPIDIAQYAAEAAPNQEALYADLLTKTGKPPASMLSKIGKGAKRFGPEMIGWYLLEKFLAGKHSKKMQDIQTQGARQGAEATTSENMYYQASLPQAKQEEQMARTALMTQISGGVIGPTLARGERRIGG